MIKFRCAQCNQKIGVPDEDAGKRVQCPTCGSVNLIPPCTPAELLPPKVVASVPTVFPQPQLVGREDILPSRIIPSASGNSDMSLSPAYLLFLSQFAKGDDPARFDKQDYWQAALGTRPATVIARFLREGTLEPAGLSEVMSHKFKVPDLKAMLRSNNLKLSGRKDELIRRLIESDEQAMAAATSDVKLLRCTNAALPMVEAYLADEKAKREEAERGVLDALTRRDFAQAVRRLLAFEAAQVFPRGLGMDWSNSDGSMQLEALDVIFNSRPGILSGIPEDRIGPFRIAAGMMELWGTHSAMAWLPRGVDTGIALDPDTACRMLIFHASHLRNMKGYREAEIKTVRVLGVGDDRTCPACRKLDGKRFRLNQVPEFPCPRCTSEMGCRCTTVAEFD
ncbi:MAG: hypothetical protein BIFFINMI_03310 [Phycisphaerae bacterium]|nr:hypothetical protein [Phycisphaerae bacterium]